ncbi:DNA-processing protein DprA [Persephonella sp.]
MSIIDYIELSFIKGLGPRRIKQIYESVGSIKQVLEEPEILLDSFGENLYRIIKNRPADLRKKAEEEYQKAVKAGAQVISLENKNYPELLKEIPDPPPVLYIKGVLSAQQQFVSVVGSRKFSHYGKNVAEKITEELVNNGLTTVSGLATGIDSIVHKATISSGGKTVAVLGNGIDMVFPQENRRLYEEVEENGALITEFPVGTKASKYTFPVRNRIIAGMSYATVVVEAGEKSGALITARIANEYGRTVIAVPTNITNTYGKGCNLLIKEGALPLTQIDDLFEWLPYLKKESVQERKIDELSQIEKQILETAHQPVHIDLLAEMLSLSIQEITVILFEMELKELISVNDGMVMKK